MKLEIHNQVISFINSQSPKVQAKIVRSIDLLEKFGLRLTYPHLKKLKNVALWELRIIFGSNIFRILINFQPNQLNLVHTFQKKSKKTPLKEIKTALMRIRKLL
ncbi:MAG: hypothetical protein CEN89_756 [Candidatus Berkelbacteria bacterium Licking1014_7]|uniref:Phage-related protein n=1 Tax=Candidatus Berkelbacteria bacterium Licking1014_7 TaxID=2017147 RepID=A0A554LHJ4_9BACT|nr:MAG: hypothetical protein CEN89_756 [Candidatus Berkelbacteria bacterium Licking1014_7]